MKQLIPFFLTALFFYSCGNDDDITTGPEEDNNDIENLVHNEATDGDLSDSAAAPTTLTFVAGDNRILAEQAPDAADYFTFTVPEGHELSALNVETFSINDPGFIGIAEGTTIPGMTAADLLGGLVYGQDEVETNILPAIGMLPDAEGFTGALPEGTYTVWLNQTGEASETTLNFVITLAEIIVDNLAHSEATDGDLSGIATAPTAVTFVAGNNLITAEQAAADDDFFTFTVPEGHELSALNVDAFSINDPGFIGIAEGTMLTGMTAADLLGGLVYGQNQLNSNILPAIGILPGAEGFTDTLPAGTYTIWLNQTGGTSETTINFVINAL